MTRSSLLSLLTLAFALLVAACSSGSDTRPELEPNAASTQLVAESEDAAPAISSDQTTGSPQSFDEKARRDRSPETTLLVAARETEASSSYRFSWRIEIGGIPEIGGPLSLDGSGAVDAAASRMAMSFDFGDLFDALPPTDDSDVTALMGLFSDGALEIIVDGGTTYLRWGFFAALLGAETDWIAFEAEEAAGLSDFPGLGQFAAPGDFLDTFGNLSDLTDEGPDTIDGVDTTRYSGTIDLLAAALELEDQGGSSPALGGLDGAGFASLDAIPVQIWLDGQNYIRRFEFAFADVIDGQEASFRMVYDLFAFGEPLTLTLPDPDDVTFISGDTFGFAGPPTLGAVSGEPDSYGDDAYLDELWDRCASGDMSDCDELYFQSQFDLKYERFGDTCGGRYDDASGLLCTNREA